jgi:hypothetical protein
MPVETAKLDMRASLAIAAMVPLAGLGSGNLADTATTGRPRHPAAGWPRAEMPHPHPRCHLACGAGVRRRGAGRWLQPGLPDAAVPGAGFRSRKLLNLKMLR